MKENRLVSYSVIFIALVLVAIVLQTFQSVLRPLAIATLLVFMVTPLARYSKENPCLAHIFRAFFVSHSVFDPG